MSIARTARRPRPRIKRHSLIRRVTWLRQDAWTTQALIGALVLAGILFNSFLSVANAVVAPMSNAIVTVCEVGILGGGFALILATGLRRGDGLPMALLYLFLLLAAGMSLINGFPFPDAVRNIAILTVFTMLGLRTDLFTLRALLVIVSALVLVFLLLEIVSTSTYVQLFQPASYYQNTRGSEIKEWDDSGLFQNARAFEGRFTFGLIDHRSASLFLEQVSLANFAGVMSIVLVTLWQRLTWWERGFYLFLIALILVTNSTRTSSAIALASVAGYFVYPHLPRLLHWLIMPGLLTVGALLIWYTDFVVGDNIVGRVSITMEILRNSDLSLYAGMEAARARTLLDSGYGYVLGSSSLVGALALWYYFVTVVPQVDAVTKRLAWALSVYVFCNMMIGGTAIFSIKVAAPLWLLVGYIIATHGKRDKNA